jgi:hypothetical protein
MERRERRERSLQLERRRESKPRDPAKRKRDERIRRRLKGGPKEERQHHG